MSVFDLPMTARPGKDAIAGQDELGRTVYRTVTGERYTMPERTEMPAPTMGQRFENLGGLASRAYEGLSVQGAIEAAKGIGGGVISGIVQGFTAPGRALSGEPVSYGDVLATAGMAQLGAAPMRAPAGSLRSGAMGGRPPVTFDDVARAMDEAPVVPPVTMQGADEILNLPDDEFVTLYHGTTKEGAEKIKQTGALKSAGEPSVYLTTDPGGGGYGDGTVVPVRVRRGLLQIDDEFPSGRADFRIDLDRPGGSVPVQIAEVPASPVAMQGAYDNLISYNEQVRKGKEMLDRDKVSGADNVLYRPDRAYRFIGPEGYDDFLKSGLIRAKTGSKQGYEVPFFMKGQSSGRYGGGEGGKYMVETIPDSKSWRGAGQEFEADKYVGPSSPITKDSPIRIFERGEDGQYRVIFDNIGDDAFLPAQSPQ